MLYFDTSYVKTFDCNNIHSDKAFKSAPDICMKPQNKSNTLFYNLRIDDLTSSHINFIDPPRSFLHWFNFISKRIYVHTHTPMEHTECVKLSVQINKF